MDNRTALAAFISTHFPRKLASAVLVFSMVAGQCIPVFAQQEEVPVVESAPTETVSIDTTKTEQGTTEAEEPAPAPSADDTADATDKDDKKEKVLKEEKKPEEDPDAAAMMAGTTVPNSSREVLQGVRSRISTQVDNVTGALIYKYPIVIPPGRNSMTPEVALVYNSADANMVDSIVGSGWSLDIPYIQRLNKTGSQNLYSTDYYTSSMSGELVSLGSNTYAARSEDGDFLTYTKSANGWTVKDKNGTVYTFGLNAQARQDNSADTAKIYKWMLEEVRDTNSNYISYEYYKDAGQIYPSKITYTGNGITAGIMEVNFDRQSKTGVLPTLWTTGFSVKTNYYISEIRTEISDTWARKYTLAYTAADISLIPLLNTITESGQDESSTVTTLPAMDFDYQTLTKGWTYDSSWALPLPFFSGDDIGMRMADINGDSLPDVICHGNYLNGVCGNNNPAQVYLNTGSGWSSASGWSTPTHFVTSQYKDTGLRIVDVNGDGLNDLALAKGSTSNSIYLNTGSGWTLNTSWTLPIPFITGGGDDYGMRMADINGDGLIDIVCKGGYSSGDYCNSANPTQVYLNTGSGWTNVSGWSAPAFVDNQYKDTGVRLVDVNADGLVDIVKAKGTSYNDIYINNGSGWTLNTSWSLPLPVVDGSNRDYGFRITDLSSEGFADILCQGGFTNGDCGTANPTVAYYNTATGWEVVGGWNLPPRQEDQNRREAFVTSSYGDNGLRLVDVDSNGLTDLVRGQGEFKFVYLHNTTKPVNFMTKITYPEGGDTMVTYKSSAQFKDGSNNLLNPNLPIIHTVVSQISDNDGVTPVVHNYSYEGGKYYFNSSLDRKFAGFAKVTDTDSAGNVKKTYYHQGNTTDTSNGEYDDHVSKIGKPYRVEEYDGSSNLYRLTVNKWDKYNIGANHDFVKLVRSTTFNYDGDSDHADTATEFAYDNTYGNLTTKTNWGKVIASTDGSFTDIGSDKSTETISYVANTGNYVVGLPYQDTVVDQSSNKVRESKTYYDTLSLGSVGAGNITKVENWVTGSMYTNSQKAYNTTYGIVTSETDPRGKVTSYSYDSNNLYPATITYPLSQTESYIYDYSLGKPKQKTDKNSFIYQTTYDGLDRVTAEKIPGESSPYTPVTKTAYAYTDTAGAVAVQRTDYLDGSISALTYQYFDGLGRLIQERKETESDYNVRDIIYSNRGLVLKESLPYSSSGTSKTAATGTAALYTNYTYDALERPLTVVNALGTTSYAYDDWKTTVTDAESNVKSYYNDARGNLMQVDEVNGSSTYSTNYEWNLNNKLTKITDALSNIRNFTYDSLGRRLTAEDLHASADGTYGTWVYAYDDAGNLTQSVSPRLLTTNYTYNDINQQLTEDYTGAGGTEISYTYGGCTNGTGKLCSVSMASGANTAYTYNSNGGIASEAKTISSTAYTSFYTYNRQGNITNITYPDSAETKYTFNTAGLLEKIERKESGGTYTDVVSNFDYNPVNQVTTQAYPNTVTTTNTYDAAKLYRLTRRLTQNTVPLKLQDLNYTYDAVGNITKIIDASDTASNKTVDYTYDDLYRLLTAATTGGSSSSWYNTLWQYRTKLTLSSSVVPNGLQNFPVYVNLANLPDAFHTHVKADGGDIRITAADGTTEVPVELVSINTAAKTGELHFKVPNTDSKEFYVYYGNSSATLPAATATYGANAVWSSSYVSVHHLEDNAANTIVKDSTVHGYNLTNQTNTANRTSAAKVGKGLDYNGTSDYSSFSTAHITDSTWTVQAIAKLDTTSLSEYRRIVGFAGWPFPIQIEADQNQTYLSTLVGGSRTNWPSAVLNDGFHAIAVSYDGTNTKVYYDGTLLQTLGNGVGSLNNAGAIGAEGSGGSKWDGIIDEVRFVDTPLSADWIAAEYSNYQNPSTFYSVSAEESEATQGQSTLTYAYDALGNITSGPIGTYLYQGNTGSLTANPHAATSINGVTYSYDTSGNLTNNGILTNTWNYKDQLTQAVKGGITSTYLYDHTSARVSLANGTITTTYPNKFYNIDSIGKKTKQIYAGDTLVATIETISGTVTPYYNHTDQLGSVTAVSNGSGTLVETLDYYPFGDQRISTGSYTGQRQYIGQEYDESTGLNYLGARYQNGAIGKFISQDPAFLAVGNNQEFESKSGVKLEQYLSDPQSLNSYSYARNNPITLKDANGNFWQYAVIGALTYAPQAISYLSSLATPLGQYAVGEAMNDAQNGNYGWAAFGLVTAGEGSSLNIAKNNTLVKNAAGELVPVFRGGEISFNLGTDFRKTYNAEKGIIDPFIPTKNPEGISININPFDKDVINHGGANQITSLPKGLQIVQSGKEGHYVIQPTAKMTVDKFTSLVDKMIKRISGKK